MSSIVQICYTYAECGVINTQGCVVKHSGYGVKNIVDRLSPIYCKCYHRYSGCDIIDRFGVMTQIQWT